MKNTCRGLTILTTTFLIWTTWWFAQINLKAPIITYSVFFISLIVWLIGIEFIWKGRKEFGPKHEKFVIIGSVILIIYILCGLLILTMLIQWVTIMLFLLGHFLYVYNLESKRGRALLWVAIVFGIIIPLISNIVVASEMERRGVDFSHLSSEYLTLYSASYTIPVILMAGGYISAIANIKKKIPFGLKIVAVAIVLLVVIASTAGAWYSSLVSQKPGLKNIQIYLSDLGENLEIKIITIPKEFSGTASFSITIDEETSYEGNINIVGGSGTNEVSYEDFVTKNGNYTIKATFENKESIDSYEINYVVENITLTMNPRVDKTATPITRWLDVTVRPDRIPKEAQVKVNIKSDEVGFLIPDTYLTAFANLYTGSFQYTKRANYTIEASLTNGKVKTNLTSSSTLTAPINTPPIADAGEDQTIQAPHGQCTVTFNASNSDDDSEIALYIWDFGDNVTANTTDPFVQHTYTVRYVMPYTVTLRVQETSFAGEKEGLYSEPDTCVVTFTMI